jgi:DNA-3-methyladenine glycosylase II
MKSDPTMKKIIKLVGPFTAKTRRDRFGALADAIIGQQISTAAAATIKQRLRDSLAAAGHEELAAESILKFDIDDLRAAGVSNQKAGYLLDLAQRVDSGQVVLKKMARHSNDKVIAELTQVKGIGVWTAQMFLIFSLGRLDVLPVDDLGIKNAMQHFYGLEERPDPDAMRTIAEPWQPYESMASWYLWQGLGKERSKS